MSYSLAENCTHCLASLSRTRSSCTRARARARHRQHQRASTSQTLAMTARVFPSPTTTAPSLASERQTQHGMREVVFAFEITISLATSSAAAGAWAGRRAWAEAWVVEDLHSRCSAVEDLRSRCSAAASVGRRTRPAVAAALVGHRIRPDVAADPPAAVHQSRPAAASAARQILAARPLAESPAAVAGSHHSHGAGVACLRGRRSEGEFAVQGGK